VPGSDYKSYQGVTLMKTTVAKLRALQEDVAGACTWIHECKAQKLLKHEGDQSWTYTQFNTPWPVTHVIRCCTSPPLRAPMAA
jgi:hypothetical protein